MISKEGKERAKLLAVELARVEREKNIESFNQAFKNIKDTISEAVETMKSIISEIVEHVSKATNNIKSREEHRKSWNVPTDTRLNSQVILPDLKIPKARSGI